MILYITVLKAFGKTLLQVLNIVRKIVQKFKIKFYPLLLKIITAHNSGRMLKKRSKKTKCILPDIDQQKSPADIVNLFANKFMQVSVDTCMARRW